MTNHKEMLMRIIYLGTPDFAVAPLMEILASRHEVVAVVTQPDRLGNRNKLIMPPVKEAAMLNNIPVYQYDKVSRQGVEDLKSLAADIMVTCAYGQILSDEVLSICPHGVINIHASLLPKYRGSCPINKAIIDGEITSGVTIMQTVKEIDAGDVISMSHLDILPNENAGELFDRLSILGAKLIVTTLDSIENGSATYTPQDHTKATHCRMLNKSDGVIDFRKSAKEVHNFIRGMTPWPSAQVMISGIYHRVHKSEIVDMHGSPATVIAADSKQGLIIATGDRAIKIAVIQAAGGKAMSSETYLLGHNIEIGRTIGE